MYRIYGCSYLDKMMQSVEKRKACIYFLLFYGDKVPVMKVVKRVLKTGVFVSAVLLLVYLSAQGIRHLRVADDSQLQTDHFKIIYSGIVPAEASAIAKHLEACYEPVNKSLRNLYHPLITVHIHPDQATFNKTTGLAGGKANGTSRGPYTIHLMYQTWFNSFFPDDMGKVAVHEFTHCAQLNILLNEAPDRAAADFEQRFEKRFAEQYPRWFWEALSDYQAGMVDKWAVKHGMRSKPSLQSLNQGNMVYKVGYTAVEYMVKKWGSDKPALFIRSYGDFREVLDVTEAEFEEGWKAFVKEHY